MTKTFSFQLILVDTVVSYEDFPQIGPDDMTNRSENEC